MPPKRHRNQVEEEEQLARRRQPLRRCKKFRYNGNTKLLDLPEDMIRVILEFSKPTKEQEGWIWLCKMGRVCHLFHEIVKAMPPTVLDVIQAFDLLPSRDSHALFLRSILDNPWMSAKLTKFVVADGDCHPAEACQCHRKVIDNPEVFHAIRSLLEKERALLNVETLTVQLFGANEPFPAEPSENLFCSLANLSSLDKLMLLGVGSTGFTSLMMLERLLATLRNPLDAFSIVYAPWLNDGHMERFLRNHGDRLTKLELFPTYVLGVRLISGVMLRAIPTYCPHLRYVHLHGGRFSNDDLEAFLRACPNSLHRLGLTDCPNLDSIRAIDTIANYAPEVRKLHLSYNDWLTSNLLERLVRGQISHWRRRPADEHAASGIPLKEIYVGNTSVTKEDAVQIIRRLSPASEGIAIYGDDWGVRLQSRSVESVE